MKKMNKPVNNIDEIINDCISNYRDNDKKEKFRSCIKYIEEYTKEFDLKISSGESHLLEKHKNVDNTLTKEEMKKLYIDKFSKKEQPGREHYDRLITSTDDGLCPYCGIKNVGTLDHFLSKSTHPTLAVSPINLVPSCSDCNKNKFVSEFTSFEDTHLHPYYDNTDTEIWLKVELKIQNNEVSEINYRVIKPDSWEESLYNKVKNHFKLFDLQNLYKIYAMNEITDIVGNRNFQELKKKSEYCNHMKNIIESLERRSKNNWKVAIYREL